MPDDATMNRRNFITKAVASLTGAVFVWLGLQKPNKAIAASRRPRATYFPSAAIRLREVYTLPVDPSDDSTFHFDEYGLALSDGLKWVSRSREFRTAGAVLVALPFIVNEEKQTYIVEYDRFDGGWYCRIPGEEEGFPPFWLSTDSF
jgi:hypothetical protein